MYSLMSENLSGLGGPMGSEHTTTNWVKYFFTKGNAKVYAERDYKENGGTEDIKWVRTNNGIRTQDLGFVMYHIDEIVVEDS